MIPGNYEQILEMISKNSGLSLEDVERKIEAKRAKLSGLISKEGAAQIIASELGISFDKQKMKISELLTGMKKINLLGKIIRMNRVVEYDKNGRSGKIGSFQLADDTSNIRVVLWDTNHISLIEDGTIAEGTVVEISGGDIRNGEMHLSSFSDIKKSQEKMDKVQDKPVLHKKTIDKIGYNDNVCLRAFVVQLYGPNFFNVCPECNKKVQSDNTCLEHGAVAPQQRAILNFILDDGYSTIRSTLFHDQIKKIVPEEFLQSSEAFMPKRDELIGKEYIVQASSRRNKLTESMELIINDLQEVNLDELIKELEA